MSHSDEHLTHPLEGEDLSALADGELSDPAAVRRACAHWRDSAETRAAWHAYQLVGDVLRSDDLASAPGHDSEFLARLRLRLAEQPVVLAPAVPNAAEAAEGLAVDAAPRAWRMPVAVAAGFVAVAGALVVFQMQPAGLPGSAGPVTSLAAARPALTGSAPPVTAVAAVATRPQPSLQASEVQPAVVLNGRLIRDARLDEYLAAHKKFGGSSAPGVPSGFLRNAAVEER